ncbi:DUF4167 domain-containing protein [Bradyrhizobium viridifuturi]|jgi:hypothetical protein|nr:MULTISPECIES: DUF4167 domain-containing protein [Bradyrhizobium]ERF79815.1 MAG: branched-chain amino acid transport system ATP-binding protein [Bradyrhizobium sp. DFCI-1]OYU58143.1 MAG: hypothetical protein CFE30_32425 [Bradyrhizobium sp. PARBB1]PSO14639.1 DUF4167 domain-containing protein [Bradyrhizobium sp. MOS004]QRI70042.1 DUF4167 domain-containing protein [Bradyrhizobium sp. PSBB068]MBR1025235.1 DUF4167 domain-containing protein [Bradyrhizobium viridifuturi]
MRNGQNNKRMRNRNNNNNNNNNNRRGQNPLTRVYESNGPDIKIRGTASHVAEKYVQLARDARSSGDPVAAENYYQHAEHYYRIIAAAQEQFRQNQQQPRPDAEPVATEDGDDDSDGYSSFGQEPGFVPQQQPFMRDNGQQPFQREQQQQPREHRERDQQPPREHREREHRPQPQYQPQPQNQPQPAMADAGGVDRLPSFITGGAQPQVNGGAYEASNGGGAERGERSERFPRRRRRPHGPRPDMAAQPAPSGDDFNPGNE